MLPSRYSRSICVDDRELVWRYTTGRAADHRPSQLVVQPKEGGSILVVRQEVWPNVTPKFVAAVIREAWAAGWLVTERNQPLYFTRTQNVM